MNFPRMPLVSTVLEDNQMMVSVVSRCEDQVTICDGSTWIVSDGCEDTRPDVLPTHNPIYGVETNFSIRGMGTIGEDEEESLKYRVETSPYVGQLWCLPIKFV